MVGDTGLPGSLGPGCWEQAGEPLRTFQPPPVMCHCASCGVQGEHLLLPRKIKANGYDESTGQLHIKLSPPNAPHLVVPGLFLGDVALDFGDRGQGRPRVERAVNDAPPPGRH